MKYAIEIDKGTLVFECQKEEELSLKIEEAKIYEGLFGFHDAQRRVTALRRKFPHLQPHIVKW